MVPHVITVVREEKDDGIVQPAASPVGIQNLADPFVDEGYLSKIVCRHLLVATRSLRLKPVGVLPPLTVGNSIVNRSSGRIRDSFTDHQLYPHDGYK